MKVIVVKDGETFNNIPKLFKDDFGFSLQFNIKDDDYDAYYVNTSEVYLRMRSLLTEEQLFNKPCDIISSAAGTVRYTFEDGDLNTSGVMVADINVSSTTLVYTFSLGKVLISEDI